MTGPGPTSAVMWPRWHRPLVAEDVETARLLTVLHQPTGLDPDRPICASATHLILEIRWPRSQHNWATWVLGAHERGEIR